jgi:hypothetical protein
MRQSAANMTHHTFPNGASTTNPTNRIADVTRRGSSKATKHLFRMVANYDFGKEFAGLDVSTPFNAGSNVPAFYCTSAFSTVGSSGTNDHGDRRSKNRTGGTIETCSATDDLRRSRRNGHSRKFVCEDASFTRQAVGMNVAAQCFGGAGDDG